MGDLLGLFSTNGAIDSLRMVLDVAQSTPVFDLRLQAFVDVYRSIYGLVLVLTLVMFAINLVSLSIGRNQYDDPTFGLVPLVKVFLVGAYLPALVTAMAYMSDLFTKLIMAAINDQPWSEAVAGGLSVSGFFTRLTANILSKLLWLELVLAQLAIPFLVLIGLVTYGLTAFRSSHVMGKPGQWTWALLVTALIFKPLVVLVIGLAGRSIIAFNYDDTARSVWVTFALFVSLFAWIFIFVMVKRGIATAVENQVQVRGHVRAERARSAGENEAAVRRMHARSIGGDGNKRQGTRTAGRAATDLTASAVSSRLAATAHPVAGGAVTIAHAFLKGRRK